MLMCHAACQLPMAPGCWATQLRGARPSATRSTHPPTHAPAPRRPAAARPGSWAQSPRRCPAGVNKSWSQHAVVAQGSAGQGREEAGRPATVTVPSGPVRPQLSRNPVQQAPVQAPAQAHLDLVRAGVAAADDGRLLGLHSNDLQQCECRTPWDVGGWGWVAGLAHRGARGELGAMRQLVNHLSLSATPASLRPATQC